MNPRPVGTEWSCLEGTPWTPSGGGYDYGRRGERKAAPAHQKRKARRYPVRPPPTIHGGRMNARELLGPLEQQPDHYLMTDKDETETILRALRLLAAAEANDGTTAETDIARAIDQLNLVAVGLEPTFSVSAKWVKGAIALIEALRNERNGLAARVVELTPDAERYRWLRKPQDHICVDVEEENEDGWTGTFYALVRDDLDAAIDAARGSKP